MAALAPLTDLRTPAMLAVAAAAKANTILKNGALPGERVAAAAKLATTATKALAKMAALLEPRTDEMPQDGTHFWVTGEGPDADVKLVRFCVLPGRESWGLAMHTVDGDVWVSHDYYRLWWPLDFFPVNRGK